MLHGDSKNEKPITTVTNLERKKHEIEMQDFLNIYSEHLDNYLITLE